MTEMKRYNNGKPQLSYLGDISEAIYELCKVFEMGAEKYGRNNWKQGGSSSIILDSLGRHYVKLASGATVDEESGLHHAAHIIWNAAAYIQLEKENKLNDKKSIDK